MVASKPRNLGEKFQFFNATVDYRCLTKYLIFEFQIQVCWKKCKLPLPIECGALCAVKLLKILKKN